MNPLGYLAWWQAGIKDQVIKEYLRKGIFREQKKFLEINLTSEYN